jgi:dihydroorotate dehydrogenase/NAD-dependent dihydropyrimidine dehydrogenase PreA subunit
MSKGLYVKEFDMANPFIIASSPATQGYKAVLKSARAMPGAIVMRNFGHGAGGGNYLFPSGPELLKTGEGGESHAIGAIRSDFHDTFEQYLEAVRKVRKEMSKEIRLWVSIGHYGDLVNPVEWEKKWVNEAKEFELAGADAVEIHFNTPGVACARNRVYDFPRAVYEAARIVSGAVKIPVMVKLPTEMTDPLRAMDAAVYGGAYAVGPTARWKGLTFDLDWKRSLPRGGGGYSGSQVLPIACYTVAEARNRGIKVPIFGGGGVYSAEAAMKLIMAGSNIAQLGSFACSFGPKAVAELIAKFEGLMDQYGYADMESLRGAAMELMNMPAEAAAERTRRLGTAFRECAVDNGRCIGCGRCVEACWYEGMEIADKKARKTTGCIGCGYCFAVCPTKALTVSVGDVLAGAYDDAVKSL